MSDLLTHDEYKAIAAELSLPVNAYVNGKFMKPKSGKTMDSLNPATGELLVRSEAARYLARRAGGGWRLVAFVAGLVPRVARDALYDFVARRRRRWFGRTEEICPVLPPELRRRFDP